jgi:DNA-directed RNA polymerase specialized sigma24 family protein
VTSLSDDALRTLIRTDPGAGWRAFIDQYTPLIVGLIRKAGLTDRDETMDVYVSVCERLSANGFERLLTQDASRGSIGGWLAVLTRHAAVDWIRSKKGRRRLFQGVRNLPPFDQRIFELYYWDELGPGEISEIVGAGLATVLESLERIQSTMTDRHRGELLALAMRSKPPVPFDDTDADRIADARMDPETAMRIVQTYERFEGALRSLPAEDAAIVRLKYVEGLSNAGVEDVIGTRLTNTRIQDILGRLRSALTAAGIDGRDASLVGRMSAS